MSEWFKTKDGKDCRVHISCLSNRRDDGARSQIRRALDILNMVEDIESLSQEQLTIFVGENSITVPVSPENWESVEILLATEILGIIEDYDLDKYPYYKTMRESLERGYYYKGNGYYVPDEE